jgi:hypothetical protein
LLGKNAALKRAQPPPQILDQLSDFQRQGWDLPETYLNLSARVARNQPLR